MIGKNALYDRRCNTSGFVKPDNNPLNSKYWKIIEKWLFCNKLDCLVIRKILSYVSNALALHVKKLQFHITEVLT